MTEQTRRNIFRYGIAIDLVILATATGMLVAAPTASLLIFAYAAAVSLSVWRGGWQGGLVALLLSIVALVAVFPDIATASHIAAFIGASVFGSALVAWATRPLKTATAEVATNVAPLAEVVPFAEEPPAPPVVTSKRARSRKRAAEKEEQRQRDQKERAERLARDRELQERVAAERRAIEEEAARVREEAERRAAEAEAERARVEEEASRLRAEAEQRAAEAEAERVRVEEERRAAEAEAERVRAAAEEEASRLRADAERRAVEAEAERRAAEEERARVEEERRAAEAERARVEEERRAAEEEAERVRAAAEAEAARLRAAAEEEAARVRAEAERRAAEADAERQRLERERHEIEERVEAARREAEETARQKSAEDVEEQIARMEAERRAAEDDLRRQLEQQRQELAAERKRMAAERERIVREAEERVSAAHQAAGAAVIAQPPAPAPKPAPPASKTSLVDTISGWFRREERPRAVNLKTKRVASNTQTRRPSPAAAPRPSHASSPAKPRVLLIERRRGTADTIAPKLKHRGVEIEVVERWVDAVDEIFRFRPHVLFLDIEHPEFDRMHRTVIEKTSQLPIVLTGRAGSTPPSLKHAAFVGRPYDLEEVVRIANVAQNHPENLLAEQSIPRAQVKVAAPTMVPTPTLRAPVVARVQPHVQQQQQPEVPVSAKPITDDEYEITCSSCRAPFNAIDADWCSCLAKERTLVCTNCLTCFCKAAPAYKEKFWVNAPPRLFERKTTEARKQGASLPSNAPRSEVKRPLVLTVEDDEEIQAIVQRVCNNLDYGFIWATNGQDGLELAREYKPNMILSDAFMPRLDGREMCRMLKEDPEFTDTRMVVMTGLYTDTKYRSEAVKRFHVDDYIAKPVAITDLINLLQKHLEGVTGLPSQEDLHELHRQGLTEHDEEEVEVLGESDEVRSDDVPLSDLLLASPAQVPVARVRADAARADEYDVCCFNCQKTFDATHAEWCSCVGRDNTLVCPHCNGCFCKAPAAYRERFWIDAPPSLFERKMIGSKRHLSARVNPAPAEVKRPLILLVEDDENVQLIVRTVVSNMGYGFVVGADGQEGLSLARQYSPDMILSDAFMPKLDGREMCRLLKEDPNTSRSKAVIMTGLYTDRKYRNEALDYFKVDDYVAKPLAVDDLIKLFKKHLPQEVTTAH